jgi:secondary thiamine-phosphate synthase enzyme
MPADLHTFQLQTKVDEIINITNEVQNAAKKTHIKNGIVNITCPGSTGGISCLEFEPGLVKTDIPSLLQQLMPEGPNYAHHQTWGDYNGHSHLRSFLINPSYTVPVVNGQVLLGTWQQLVFCEFDEKPRVRTIYCQFVG